MRETSFSKYAAALLSATTNASCSRDLKLMNVLVASDRSCRIMDFGKWLYEQKRKNKQSNKKQHTVVLKEIRLRPKIDQHDLQIKVNHAIKFIVKGHKVQFTMLFRGREMMFVNRGYEIMTEVLETMEECSKLEREAKMLGRRMAMVVNIK